MLNICVRRRKQCVWMHMGAHGSRRMHGHRSGGDKYNDLYILSDVVICFLKASATHKALHGRRPLHVLPQRFERHGCYHQNPIILSDTRCLLVAYDHVRACVWSVWVLRCRRCLLYKLLLLVCLCVELVCVWGVSVLRGCQG